MRSYSVSVRLRRTTTETAHLSVRTTADLISPDPVKPDQGTLNAEKIFRVLLTDVHLEPWRADCSGSLSDKPRLTAFDYTVALHNEVGTSIAWREKAPVLTTRSGRQHLQPQATREFYIKASVPVSTDGRGDGAIQLYDVITGQLINTLKGPAVIRGINSKPWRTAPMALISL